MGADGARHVPWNHVFQQHRQPAIAIQQELRQGGMGWRCIVGVHMGVHDAGDMAAWKPGMRSQWVLLGSDCRAGVHMGVHDAGDASAWKKPGMRKEWVLLRLKCRVGDANCVQQPQPVHAHLMTHCVTAIYRLTRQATGASM